MLEQKKEIRYKFYNKIIIPKSYFNNFKNHIYEYNKTRGDLSSLMNLFEKQNKAKELYKGNTVFNFIKSISYIKWINTVFITSEKDN